MDTVTILRDLWRLRFAVIGVWVMAMVAGVLVLYKVSPPSKLESRKYNVGVATTSILIDTPSSQVVEIDPEGSVNLGVRADLLSRLMVDGVVKDTIADTAGIPSKALVGVSASAADQAPVTKTNRLAPILTTRVVVDNNGSELPIIEVTAQAANAESAGKLANAAVEGLRKWLDSKAAAQQLPDAKRLQVGPLGATQVETVTRGPKDVFAVAAVIFLFGLGCACLLIVTALRRSVRAAVAAEKNPQPAASAPAPAPAPVAAQHPVEPARSAPGPRRAPAVPVPPSSSDSWFSSPTTRPALTVAPTTPAPDAAETDAPPKAVGAPAKDRSLMRRRASNGRQDR